ncbi:hypothetical protein ILYODFUR_005422 [Ilyodon furcidens]|uniref:Uncharacterized protein n=1 Tax=Ilyodon furcidens TaxID=33524 RepID=A0ABV0U420_9TELE
MMLPPSPSFAVNRMLSSESVMERQQDTDRRMVDGYNLMHRMMNLQTRRKHRRRPHGLQQTARQRRDLNRTLKLR